MPPQVAALVWLGSQATKPARITLAVLLAPVAEVVLQATERHLNLPSRRRAFWTLFAAILVSTVTLCATAVAYAALRAVASAPTGSTPASAAVMLLLSPFGRPRERGSCYGRGCLSGCLTRGAGGDFFYGATGRLVAPASRQSRGSSAADNNAQLAWGGSTVVLQTRRGEKLSTTRVSSTKEAGMFLGGGEQSGRRMSPQKIADKNPPPQDNIHGWNEHPNHLLGLWRVGDAEAMPAPDESWADEAIAAAAPSLAAAEALAAAGHGSAQGGHPEHEGHSSLAAQLERGGYSSREKANRDMVDFGSDVLHHVGYVVLRRGGDLKAGPADLGVAPRSWRFTPANRRLVFEVDVPGRRVTLRWVVTLYVA